MILLLEWVGRWSIATSNGECRGQWATETDAWIWVRKTCNGADDPEEYLRVQTRFRIVLVALPPRLVASDPYDGTYYEGPPLCHGSDGYEPECSDGTPGAERQP